MGKLIAVYGSNCSGKTTFALKLAQEIYFNKASKVIFLSSDMKVPSLSYIFPKSKDDELYSLGVALDKTDVFKEDILKQIKAVKNMRNFGFMGFKGKENKDTYPHSTEDKLNEFFGGLLNIADYVVVDCTSDIYDNISYYALKHSDMAIRLITADLKCMGYYASQGVFYESVENKSITVLNVMDNDIFLPIDEVKAHFKKVSFTLPYSNSLKQQSIKGTLSEKLSDSKYRFQVQGIARRVI